MGEVYRAHDARLGRDVALKLLPDGLTQDPDRVARFRREAQLLAALNHPGIAAIYGLEETDSVRALVLELVEGETLASRLAHGPLPLDEALPIAGQIVDAINAAHAQGIVHRDLKPANISVRADSTVKVLDLGWAKLTAPAAGSEVAAASPAQLPTVTTPALTAMGLILGTAAYMAPEQARGRNVDRRADIWAFGCVLYELLTGRRAFEGSDVSETLAAILKTEPYWTALPAGTPEPIRRTIWRLSIATGERRVVATLHSQAAAVAQFLPDGRRFLVSDASSNRLFVGSLDTSDLSLVMEDAQNAVYSAPGFLLFIRAGIIMVQPFDAARGTITGEPTTLVTDVSSVFTLGLRGNLSASLNGVLAYRQSGASDVGGDPVWVDRDGRETALPGLVMDGGLWFPQISPSGRRLAFVTNNDLWIAELDGRPPVRLTFGGAGAPAFTPLWSRDGRQIIYEQGGKEAGLWSIPADGGSRTAVRVRAGHFHPHGWSADGRELMAVLVFGSAGADIVALPFGGTPGEPRPIAATPSWEGIAGASVSPDGRRLAYAATTTGRNEIWVQPFTDGGAPVRVSPGGGVEPVWARDGGTLFYREGARVLASRVGTSPDDTFGFEAPVTLFEGNYLRGEFLQPPSYDVAPDGRFLMLKWRVDPGESHVVVVSNWLAEYERLRRP